MDEIGKRLEEEVERLGGVTAVAARLNTVRNTIYNWVEKGNIPAKKLADLGVGGADVLYILTGVRSAAAPVLGVEQQRAGYSVEVLSRDEQFLVENFRACPPEEKQHIAKASDLLAKPKRRRA